jgi:coatomer subunit beta
MSVSSTAYKHSELEATPAVHEIFLEDTKAVCTKMLGAQEVNFLSRL